jgi:hypothetical protein
MKQETKRDLLIFILLCWTGAVLSLLWYPSVPVPQAISRITFYDKGAHMVFFGVMTYLLIAISLTWEKFKFFFQRCRFDKYAWRIYSRLYSRTRSFLP